MICSNIKSAGRSLRSSRRCLRGIVAVEAAVVMPIFLTALLIVWEAGHLIQVKIVLNEAAREVARLAAGGASNTDAATMLLIQQRVQDCLQAEGFPAAAAAGAQVTIAGPPSSWSNPCDAQPLDPFTVTVTIPAGPAFNSLQWILAPSAGISDVSATVIWWSANDSKVTVDDTLPF